MKRNKLVALILSAITLVSMAGCGGSDKNNNEAGSDTDAKGDTIELRMAWWGSQTRHDATVKVIEMYEEQNQGVDIQYEFMDGDGYVTKLNTLVASNTVWDIFQLGGNFPTYLDKIVPLNDFIDKGVIDVSNTTDALLATTMHDGNQIGISNGVNSYGFAYDPQLFADAGVPEPTQNWTWADFESACLTIHEKLGIYGASTAMRDTDFVLGCSMGIPQEDYSLNFFALTNDKLGFDDPGMLENYMVMRTKLTNAGAYPDPGALAEVKDLEGDHIVSGEAAMTWIASNQFATLSTAAGRPLKLAPAPRKKADGPSGAAVQSSQMLCVSTDSKVQEEAAKFINFFANDIEANKILNGERGVSIMSNVREMHEANADEASKEMFGYIDMIAGMKTGEVNLISPPQKAEIQDQYQLILDQMIFGEKTGEQAAKEFFDFATSKFN